MSERQDQSQTSPVCVSQLNFTPKHAPGKRIISSRSLRKESPETQNALNKGIDSSPTINNTPNSEGNRRSSRLRKKTTGLLSEPLTIISDGNTQNQLFVSDSNQSADFNHENSLLQRSSENQKAASTNDRQSFFADSKNVETVIVENCKLEKRSQESFQTKQQTQNGKQKPKIVNQSEKEETRNPGKNDLLKEEKSFAGLNDDPITIQERNQWIITVLKAILFNNKFGKHISCNKVRFKAKILMRKIGPQTIKSCKIFSLESEENEELHYSKMSTTKIQCFEQMPRLAQSSETGAILEPEVEPQPTEMQQIVCMVEETEHQISAPPVLEHTTALEPIALPSPETPNPQPQEPFVELPPDQNEVEEALEDCCLIAQSVSPDGLRCELRSIVREEDDFYTFQLLINEQNKIVSSQKVRLGQLMREQRDMAFRFMLEEFWKMKERYEEFIGSFCIFAQRIGDATIRADK